MANLAIKGHETRGKEVIEILEMLGGKNIYNQNGKRDIWYILSDNTIKTSIYLFEEKGFTLEEFEEKFPYKVGDKVTLDKFPCVITGMSWYCDDVIYYIKGNDFSRVVCSKNKDLQPYKEENYCQVIDNDASSNGVNTSASLIDESIDRTNKVIFDTQAQSCNVMNDIIKKDMEQIEIDIPNGYEFFGIDDNKIIFTKKQPQYPTTYLECCRIVNASPYVMLVYDISNGQKYSYDVDNLQIHNSLRKLKICRDAYWKIAGEEMGLDKP